MERIEEQVITYTLTPAEVRTAIRAYAMQLGAMPKPDAPIFVLLDGSASIQSRFQTEKKK